MKKNLSFVGSEKWAKGSNRQCEKNEDVYFMDRENKYNLFVLKFFFLII